ncbi:MAG: cation:H+ antiporter, partial [Limisphaerales bacterium]
MPEILIQLLIFVGSLALLVKCSDWFIGGSERIGLALGLPPFIVGVTVVATGTSLPELISSILAVTHNSSEIVIGNVVGSNIANICLVLGLVAMMSGKFLLKHNIIRAEVPILIGSTFLLYLTVSDGVF